MTSEPPPAWRLPDGVDPALWRYAHTPRLAVEEDEYFADHPLFARDARLLDEHFAPPGRLVDLGSGAGRHAIRFAARGFDVTAIDLSRPMLEVVAAKARRQGLTDRLSCLQANLVRLDGLADESFDYAVSMFSTLGMIRTFAARHRALIEARRILRPGGRLALHAHNVWLNLADPHGRRWLLAQVGRRLLGRTSFGDRTMTYRGVAGMQVHLYRWSELAVSLRAAGFRVDEVVPLDAVDATTISAPWLFPRYRAGGWIVFAGRR